MYDIWTICWLLYLAIPFPTITLDLFSSLTNLKMNIFKSEILFLKKYNPTLKHQLTTSLRLFNLTLELLFNLIMSMTTFEISWLTTHETSFMLLWRIFFCHVRRNENLTILDVQRGGIVKCRDEELERFSKSLSTLEFS